jgi:hypothetical protein
MWGNQTVTKLVLPTTAHGRLTQTSNEIQIFNDKYNSYHIIMAWL